ncbi:hypothetical protein [Natrinema versiforme]|uniref:Uncharacterized protein n=1 Tax=Natrinema versiforme JCM 10478 TaxID=1227496 RepID=L9YA99_9EURY|nr:hypothetical protein [Natrinema versiforme]ELY70546.1 hypothetical protein C489_02271 [Natrinema versiforme JCM 10478]
MFELISILMSALYVIQGLLGLFEQRLYTDTQRSRAPLLSRVHLLLSIAITVVGVGSAFWVRLRGLPTIWYPTILSCGLFVQIVVQGQTYRAMGVPHSPLIDHVSARLH